MTKAHEKLKLYPYTYCTIDGDDEFNGWTTPNPDDDLEGWEGATQYIRADLHAELMRAADELYDVVTESVRSDDGYYDYYQEKVDAALATYKQAKGKLG